MGSWLARKAAYEAMAKTIDPAIQLVDKESSWLMQLYARLPWLGEEFLKRTATVLGARIYLTRGGDTEHDIVHEGQHVRQKRWCSLGLSPWLGWPLFSLLTVLVLPVVFTLRFWFELDAEAAALRYKFKTGSSACYVRQEMHDFAELLVGSDYIWSWWPKSWALRIANRRAVKILIKAVG